MALRRHIERVLQGNDALMKVQPHACTVSHIDKSFLDGLAQHIQDPIQLRKCLLPLTTARMLRGTLQKHTHDSLLRLLLSISFLQSAVVDLLLERLPQFVGEEEYGHFIS